MFFVRIYTGVAYCSPAPIVSLCRAMNGVSEMINTNINSDPVLAGTVLCTTLDSCDQVDCSAPDGEFSIILGCNPAVGMILKFVNTSESPPLTNSQLFTESGVFLDDYQVTVDQWNSTAFGFALRIHIAEDEFFVFDLPLVDHTFIPYTTCDFAFPSTTPTAVPSSTTSSTEAPSTATTHTAAPSSSTTSSSSTSSTPPTAPDSGGTTPSSITSSTSSTVPEPSDTPESSEICKTMKNVTDQINSQISTDPSLVGSVKCSLAENCTQIGCSTPDGPLTFTLSCSPVGMWLEFDNPKTGKSMLVTHVAQFQADAGVLKFNFTLGVTINQRSDNGFVFELWKVRDVVDENNTVHFVFDLLLVNHTFISCNTHTPNKSPTPTPTPSSTPTPSHGLNTCGAMENIAHQLNNGLYETLPVRYTCKSTNCATITCSSDEFGNINFYLSCSPVGMTIEFVVHNEEIDIENKTLFTESTVVDGLSVTIHNYNDEMMEFGIQLQIFEYDYLYDETDYSNAEPSSSTYETVLNNTLIPLDYCNKGSNGDSGELTNPRN